MVVCGDCGRRFHVECLGVREEQREWKCFDCSFQRRSAKRFRRTSPGGSGGGLGLPDMNAPPPREAEAGDEGYLVKSELVIAASFPKSDPVTWAKIVWFADRIPKHAFILWLVFLRKLKTQDRLQPWDMQGTDLNALSCPSCNGQPDSHEHLFFECQYSSQVWFLVKSKAKLVNVTSNWDAIVHALMSCAHKRTFQSEVAKLIVATSVYFVWKERNERLFKDKKTMPNQLAEAIRPLFDLN